MKQFSKLVMLLLIIAAVTMCFVGCVKTQVVTFVLGEENVVTLSADKEGKVIEPSVTVPEGKYIVGWYTDVDRTVEFKFETDKVDADTTLYAKVASLYHRVTFMVNGEDSIIANSDKEGNVLEPKVDIPEGKYIMGWYTDVDRTIEFKFETDKVNVDTTLYAKVASHDFSVKYNLGYAEPEHGEDMPATPTQSTVNLDDSFEVAAVPDRAGYDFLGWTDGVEVYQPGDEYEVEVTGNITLTAMWTTKMLTVRFYDDIGLLIKTKIVPYGSDVPTDDVFAPHTYPQCYVTMGWDEDLTDINCDLDVNAVYEYQHADYSWFEFVPVVEDDVTVAYKIKMAPHPLFTWQGKRFAPSGLYAFPDTYNGLAVIGFAEAIQKLGKDDFDEQDFDIELFIPDSFTRIDADSITDSKIKSLSIGRGVEYIDSKAFNASVIGEFIVAEENEYYTAEDAYLYNKDKTTLIAVDRSLPQVIIGESVKYIGADLVYSRNTLQSLVIKGDIEEIGLNAFTYCTNLLSVEIEGSVKKLVDGDDVAKTSGEQRFPPFAFCRSLQSINLKGIEYIGFGAFTGCALTSITIDTTIQFIAEECFVDLPRLATLRFPGNATVSNNGKFICEDNTLIEKEASEIMIDENTNGDVFIYYAPLQQRVHYDIPNSVREIMEYAFEYSKIKTITIPEGVKELPGGMFEDSSIIEIEIPESIETLGMGDESRGAGKTNISTVFGRSDLAEVTFANNCRITDIPDSAFYGTELVTIRVPASVTVIGRAAFGCDTLKEITVQTGNEYYEAEDGVLYTIGKTEIHSYPAAKEGLLYQAPSSVEKVLSSAFADSQELNRVELNEGSKQIMSFAFLRSEIKEIIFPSTIEAVDVSAFYMSYRFTYIEFKAEQPFAITDFENYGDDRVFTIQDINALTVKVPFASHNTYRQWLNDKSNGIGECIDANDYPDEYVTKYVFISQGVSETIKAITLLNYPIPTWTGEGAMYFNGWFKDEGVWLDEISVPCELDINTTHTYYARWETTQRKDGTSVNFAYELPIDEWATVTLYSNIVYFKETLVLDTDEYSNCHLRLYVNGNNEDRVAQVTIAKADMPTDLIKYVSVNFDKFLPYLGLSDFEGYPYQIQLKFGITLQP